MARYIFPAGSVTSTGTRQRLVPYLSTTDETPETEIAYVRGTTETGKGRQSIVTDESGAYTAFVGPEGASTLLLERPNGTRVSVTSSTATTDTTPAGSGASASALAADPAFTGTYAAKSGGTYTGTHDFTGATVTGVSGGGGGGSGLPAAFVSKTANYTAAAAENVLADADAAGFTVTLPAAPATGASVIVQKTDAGTNVVTVAPSGGGTINGQPNAQIAAASTWVFVHRGSNLWQLTAGTGASGAQLNTSAGNIASGIAGAAAAGATGLAADAGHRHPIGTHTHSDATNGGQIPVGGINATGTASGSTFLRGDGAWASPSTSFPSQIPQPGDWFTSMWGNGNATPSNSLNDMYWVPVWIPASMTVNSIAIVVNTAAATSVIRLGIWSPDATTQRPGSLVLDCGTVDASTTGVKQIAISQALSPGMIWLSAVSQVAPSQWRAFTSITGPSAPPAASNLVIQTPGANHLRQSSVTGALPATATPTFAGNVSGTMVPIIGLVRA